MYRYQMHCYQAPPVLGIFAFFHRFSLRLLEYDIMGRALCGMVVVVVIVMVIVGVGIWDSKTSDS